MTLKEYEVSGTATVEVTDTRLAESEEQAEKFLRRTLGTSLRKAARNDAGVDHVSVEVTIDEIEETDA